jgi:hypothetical protein
MVIIMVSAAIAKITPATKAAGDGRLSVKIPRLSYFFLIPREEKGRAFFLKRSRQRFPAKGVWGLPRGAWRDWRLAFGNGFGARRALYFSSKFLAKGGFFRARQFVVELTWGIALRELFPFRQRLARTRRARRDKTYDKAPYLFFGLSRARLPLWSARRARAGGDRSFGL